MSEINTAHEEYFIIEPEVLQKAVERASADMAEIAVKVSTHYQQTRQRPYGYTDSNLRGFDDW